MLNLLTDMLNAQETPEKWKEFRGVMATIENNQQAAQADFREVGNDKL